MDKKEDKEWNGLTKKINSYIAALEKKDREAATETGKAMIEAIKDYKVTSKKVSKKK